MKSYEELIKRLEITPDKVAQGVLLESLDPELLDDPQVAALVSRWNARYYYADKKKARVGDRFVWIYLSAGAFNGGRASKTELSTVFEQALGSSAAKKAWAGEPAEFLKELDQAARLYVQTLETPPRVLGMFSVGNSDIKNNIGRISRLLVQKHLVGLWESCQQLDHFDHAVAALLAAATDPKYPDMLAALVAENREAKKPEFRSWLEERLTDLSMLPDSDTDE